MLAGFVELSAETVSLGAGTVELLSIGLVVLSSAGGLGSTGGTIGAFTFDWKSINSYF